MTTTANTAGQTTGQSTALQLQPYIFFYGRTAEALEFYKKVFSGTYEMMRNSDSPMADQVPPEAKNNIMHASFTAPGVSFFASDGRETKAINPDEGNVSLALNATDRKNGERAFNALAEGGKITMPLDDAFWGGRFGIVQDRFGIEWMFTMP